MAYTETTWKRWNNKGRKLLIAYQMGDDVKAELVRVCDKLSDHRRWIGKGDEGLREEMVASEGLHLRSRRIAREIEIERLGGRIRPECRELSAYEAELRLAR